MNFRSAIPGRWVTRLFARSNPATTVEETSVPPTRGEFKAALANYGLITDSTTTSGGGKATFTTPNPYPFPTITGVGGPFKAQIRCRHCDKLTPIDAACRWCQSELDGGDAA